MYINCLKILQHLKNSAYVYQVLRSGFKIAYRLKNQNCLAKFVSIIQHVKPHSRPFFKGLRWAR